MGLVALIVTLVAVLAAAGHAGYLAMLSSVAKKRPGGQPTVEFVKKRIPVAGAALGVTLLALLIASGDSVSADIIGILVGGGGGLTSIKALQSTQTRFRSGQY